MRETVVIPCVQFDNAVSVVAFYELNCVENG